MTTNNHPAHGPVSLDRLHQIREHLQHDTQYSNGGNRAYILADVLKVIDEAIAAFGAEPVAYIFKHPAGKLFWALTDESNKWQSDVMPVYDFPTPSFVPPAIEPDYEVIKSILPTSNPDEYACCIAADMWNACRAAMSHGAEPVSNSDELPLDYLQGLKDGLEWAAQLAEGNHPQTGDWLYDDPIELARAIRKGPDMPTIQDGNSPVTPYTWIPVSERMPDEIGRYWCYVEEQNSLGKSHYQWNCSWNGERWWVESDNGGRVTHWMPLPAAPQQEVGRG